MASHDRTTRAAFRAFVRTHHPDAGGDPAVFAAGVAEFRQALASAAKDRYDAPVVVVRRPRGIRLVLQRFRELRARWKRGPRVR